MDIIWTILAFVYGSAITSYIVLKADRVHTRITNSRSVCDSCGKRIPFLYVIPVIGYFISRGKCVHCGSKITIKYPIFELVGGLFFAISYLHIGLTWPLLSMFILYIVLLFSSITDMNKLVVFHTPIYIGFGLQLLMSLFLDSTIYYLDGTIVFILLMLFSLIMSKLLKRDALGGGDIVVFAYLAFILGFMNTLLILFLSSCFGLLYILYTKKRGEIPFVPFIGLASTIVALYGNEFTAFYMALWEGLL